MSFLGILDSYSQELAQIRQWQLRNQAVRARVASITDEDAANMARTMRTFPNVGLSFHEAIAKEHLPLDHPNVLSMIDSVYQRNSATGKLAPTHDMSPGMAAQLANWKNRPSEWGDEQRLPFRLPDPPKSSRRSSNTPLGNLSTMPPAIRKIIREDPRWVQRQENPGLYPFWRDGIVDGYGNLRLPVEAVQNVPGKPFHFKHPDDEEKARRFFELASIIHEQTGAEQIPFMGANGPQILNYSEALKVLQQVKPPYNPDYAGALFSYGPISEPGVQQEKLIKTVSNMIGDIQIPIVPNPPHPGRQTAGPGIAAGPRLKDVSRAGFMSLDAPLQEGVGLFRSAVTGQAPSIQSDLGHYLKMGAPTDPDAIGTGWLIDQESEVSTARKEAERAYGTIGGHAISPGRWLADTVNLSPDSFAFDLVSGSLDFAVQVLDPTALAFGKISRISEARRLFEPEEITGAFRGIRKMFHGETWQQFKNTDLGIAVREVLAGETNSRNIFKVNPHWDPEWAQDFADAKNVEEVDAVFDKLIGTYIRNQQDLGKIPVRLGDSDFYNKYAFAYHDAISSSRLTAMLPSFHLDSVDKRQAATHLLRWMKLGKASESAQDQAFEMIARAQTKNGIEQAAELAMTHENGILANAGVTSAQRRRIITRLFLQSQDDAMKSAFQDVITDHPIREYLVSRGERIQDISPQLTSEYLQRYVPLPDIRQIQRAIASPLYKWAITPQNMKEIGRRRAPQWLMDNFINEVWKPGMLLGRFPAWISRVVGEEQLRIMASGLHGLQHPISYIALSIGMRTKGLPSGAPWEALSQFESSMARHSGGRIRRPGSTRARPILLDRDNLDVEDDFDDAWAHQFAALHGNATSRTLLNSNVEDTIKWLIHNDEGRLELLKLREAEPGQFDTIPQIRQYLTDTLGDRIHVITNDNPDLVAAARDGALRGQNIIKKGGIRGKGQVDPKFTTALREYRDQAPRGVKAFEDPTMEELNIYKRAVDKFFAGTMSRATDFVSRSPAFKQFFYRELARTLAWADDEVIEAALAGAREQNVSRNLMRRMERAAGNRATDRKIHSLAELEMIAGGYAADSTKRLLYDYAERGNVAEALGLVAPFANAYQEMLTTWPRIIFGKQYGFGGKMAKALQISRRAQQVIQGARRSGIFMKDQYGDEVFVNPFSEWYTKKMAGVPVQLTGKVDGLNMVTTNVFPGLGPIVSIPVAGMLQNKPGLWEEIYDKLLPYGAPGERKTDDIFNWLSYAPSWMQKMAMAITGGPPPGLENIPGISAIWKAAQPNAPEVAWDNVAYMNTQKDVMRYMLSTGDFDVSTPGGMNRLLEASADATNDLYYVRAAVQFFSPTAPQYQFLVQDRDGKNIALASIVEEFYSNLDEPGMTLDEATWDLMDKYGVDIFSLTVPKTKAATFAVPRTKEAGMWVQRNPDIRNSYPLTYGLFAPQGGKDYDYGVLVDQFTSGAKDVLTPSEWLNLRNEMLKSMIYYHYKNQIGDNPTPQEDDNLRRIRSELEDAYPSSTGSFVKLDEESRNEAIFELQRAVEDPKLEDTDMGTAVRLYLTVRDMAIEEAQNRGYETFSKPRAMYGTRQWLADAAQKIIKKYPVFELAWTNLLSREVERELR